MADGQGLPVHGADRCWGSRRVQKQVVEPVVLVDGAEHLADGLADGESRGVSEALEQIPLLSREFVVVPVEEFGEDALEERLDRVVQLHRVVEVQPVGVGERGIAPGRAMEPHQGQHDLSGQRRVAAGDLVTLDSGVHVLQQQHELRAVAPDGRVVAARRRDLQRRPRGGGCCCS